MKTEIQPQMPVIAADGSRLGTVERAAGNRIKLVEPFGHHEWIPMEWVGEIDEAVRLRITREQALIELEQGEPETP